MAVNKYGLSKDSVDAFAYQEKTIPLAELKDVLVGKVSVDLPSIAAGDRGSKAVTVTGATTAHNVVVTPMAQLTAGLIVTGAKVTADDTLTVYATNTTGAAIDEAAFDLAYVMWK